MRMKKITKGRIELLSTMTLGMLYVFAEKHGYTVEQVKVAMVDALEGNIGPSAARTDG